MNFGRLASENGGCQAVPQANRGSAAVANSSRAGVALFSLAMMLQVPVGYQDETGFHCGTPEVEVSSMVWEPENMFPDSSRI